MISKEEAVKAYEDLIQLRRSDVLEKDKSKLGQIEIHHILPISCGGEDVEDNKIALYAKEHFMAHVYLWVIHHDDEFHYQMVFALNNMIKGTISGNRTELRDFILASEEYQKAREEFAKYNSETIGSKISGEKNGAFGKHWYYNPLTLETKMYYDNNIPYGWKLGRIVNERDRTTTIQILMNKANNIELRKRINACRVVFFTMYYQYYLKYGFKKKLLKHII